MGFLPVIFALCQTPLAVHDELCGGFQIRVAAAQSLGILCRELEMCIRDRVYTQLTEVEDEVNGLFTYDRAEIKPDANAVRSVNAALAAEFAKVTR